MTVIDDLAKLGWFPVQAKQCRAKKNSSGVRSFHMIALQNPNIKIMKTSADGTQVVDTYPRIIMTNSHDGYNSFKFMLGLFRLVCSNGLVVCDNQMVNMSIRHINYTFEELRRIVAQAIEEVPNIVNTMNKMRTIELSEEQKKNIARSMFKIRKNVEENAQIEVSDEVLEDILTPVRAEDKRNDLWTVFNICQEKMIKGGFSASSKNNKTRKQRGITSIKKDMEFNQRLWGVASEYLAA
jgi:thioester reductase-like protein